MTDQPTRTPPPAAPRRIELIPTALIAEAALLRDRTALDPDALGELKQSILARGLRQPIEVFELPEPEGGRRFGLVSGFRRLAAVRGLEAWGVPGHDTIAAFVVGPASVTDAMTAMVEENVIRADVSPWEQARLAVAARDEAHYPTIDAAVDGLYANLSRSRRLRMRTVAQLVEEIGNRLTAPETLSQRRLLRLAAAAGRGYGELMRHALEQHSDRAADAQWALLLPILAECEDTSLPDPRPERGHRDRPRRLYRAIARPIEIRRERCADGWILRVTGREATSPLMDTVFDQIEALLSPG